MTIIEFLLLLLIAAVAGAIGQSIAGYAAGGFLAATAIGFIGALLGMWIARSTGLPEPFAINIGGRTFPVLWAIIGAALFSAIIRLITSPTRRYHA